MRGVCRVVKGRALLLMLLVPFTLGFCPLRLYHGRSRNQYFDCQRRNQDKISIQRKNVDYVKLPSTTVALFMEVNLVGVVTALSAGLGTYVSLQRLGGGADDANDNGSEAKQKSSVIDVSSMVDASPPVGQNLWSGLDEMKGDTLSSAETRVASSRERRSYVEQRTKGTTTQSRQPVPELSGEEYESLRKQLRKLYNDDKSRSTAASIADTGKPKPSRGQNKGVDEGPYSDSHHRKQRRETSIPGQSKENEHVSKVRSAADEWMYYPLPNNGEDSNQPFQAVSRDIYMLGNEEHVSSSMRRDKACDSGGIQRVGHGIGDNISSSLNQNSKAPKPSTNGNSQNSVPKDLENRGCKTQATRQKAPLRRSRTMKMSEVKSQQASVGRWKAPAAPKEARSGVEESLPPISSSPTCHNIESSDSVASSPYLKALRPISRVSNVNLSLTEEEVPSESELAVDRGSVKHSVDNSSRTISKSPIKANGPESLETQRSVGVEQAVQPVTTDTANPGATVSLAKGGLLSYGQFHGSGVKTVDSNKSSKYITVPSQEKRSPSSGSFAPVRSSIKTIDSASSSQYLSELKNIKVFTELVTMHATDTVYTKALVAGKDPRTDPTRSQSQLGGAGNGVSSTSSFPVPSGVKSINSPDSSRSLESTTPLDSSTGEAKSVRNNMTRFDDSVSCSLYLRNGSNKLL